MNTTLIVMGSGNDCVTVIIEDDDVPESNETFQVLFTECDVGGEGSGSGMMTTDTTTDGVLTPMGSDETVTITIIDNDVMGEFSYPRKT